MYIHNFFTYIDFLVFHSIFLTAAMSWIVFSQSLSAECIKISITSSCINIDFVLINASSTFTNILIYFTKDIKTDFVKRACDDYFVFFQFLLLVILVIDTSHMLQKYMWFARTLSWYVLRIDISLMIIDIATVLIPISVVISIDMALALEIVIATDRNFLKLYLRSSRSKSFWR